MVLVPINHYANNEHLCPGVYHQWMSEKSLPHDDQYIHSVMPINNTDQTLIITFTPFLLSLIHKTNAFEVDTTFSRIVGKLNKCLNNSLPEATY